MTDIIPLKKWPDGIGEMEAGDRVPKSLLQPHDASEIAGLDDEVRAATLDGLNTGSTADVTAADSVLSALGKLQAARAGKVDSNDPRLSDAREWSAETVAQAEAESGTETTRRAWTAQRVRQAVVAWWNSVSSAWGRGFVTSADAAAGRTSLGLGNAAQATLTTSDVDTTAGRALKVGAFGIGQTGSAPAISNIDLTNIPSGLFLWDHGVTTGTKPPGAGFNSTVFIERFSPGIIKQTWTDINGGSAISPRTWVRTSYLADTWGPWREAYNQDNILGTVSQSAGVPTGAIIERGSNANGEYVRFADGTQICSGRLSGGLGSATEHGSSLYYYLKLLTWPASFSGRPTLSGCGVDNMNMGTTGGYDLGLYSGQLVYITPTAGVTNTDIGWTAIGRWY